MGKHGIVLCALTPDLLVLLAVCGSLPDVLFLASLVCLIFLQCRRAPSGKRPSETAGPPGGMFVLAVLFAFGCPPPPLVIAVQLAVGAVHA